MKRIETSVLMRASGMRYIMTNGQGKTNLQKYEDAKDTVAVREESKATQIMKLNTALNLLLELEKDKENEVPTRKGSKSPREKYEAQILIVKKETERLEFLTANLTDAREKLEALEAIKDVPSLSATCKKFLKSMAIEIRYGRKKRIENKYMKKGTIVQDESVELYSELVGEEFESNKKRRENDYFTGEWDIEVQDQHGKIEEVKDVKSRFDIDSFNDHRDEEIQAGERDQLMVYCDLLGCEKSSIVNVLTNTPTEMILDELRILTMRENTEKLEGFDLPMARVLEVVKDHIFNTENYNLFIGNYYASYILSILLTGTHPDNDAQEMYDSFIEVPLEERVIEVAAERDDEYIQTMYKRVEDCRKWLAANYNIHHVNKA